MRVCKGILSSTTKAGTTSAEIDNDISIVWSQNKGV